MERKKHILSALLIIFTAFPVNASWKSEIYNAYINNRMDLWKNVIDRMNADEVKNKDLLLELVNYQYGYIGYCIEFDRREEARYYLDLAEKNISLLERGSSDLSITNSYRSAFYGFRIAMNKLSAPVNGVKSFEHGRRALELNSSNYFALIQYGNVQFNMPAAFGGSKQAGIEYFLKAKKIMEDNPSDIMENWNYLNLLVLIGQSYTIVNDLASARKIYENILSIEPDFIYIKNNLYPALLKKMKE